MMIRKVLFSFVLLGMIACNNSDTSTENAAPVQEADSSITSTEESQESLPKTLQDTLMLEGKPEPVKMVLYNSPEGFPLPFQTYLPENFVPEALSRPTAETIRFSMGEAHLSFVVLPDNTGRSKAQSVAKASLGTANIQSCRSGYAWQWECLYIAGKGAQVGRVLLGEQHGRQFYFLISYPATYGNGFGPRYVRVLEEWKFNL